MLYLGQRMLSKIHQMGKQREGDLQAGGQQGRVQALGTPQKQTRHELRDHGQSSQVGLTLRPTERYSLKAACVQVLLSERNPGQGRRTETGLPVC